MSVMHSYIWICCWNYAESHAGLYGDNRLEKTLERCYTKKEQAFWKEKIIIWEKVIKYETCFSQ